MRLFLPLLFSALLASPVMAQSRYTTWSDPDSTKTAPAATSSGAEINALIKELNALVDEATKARAANPLFLQDLKALAQKYSAPTLRRVISDNFSDGNFTHAPRWTVSSGDYRVEKSWGLRSVATANTRQDSGQTSQDPAAALLGALLQGALKGQNQTGGQTTAGVAGPSAASIYTSASINNAFDLTMEISSWKNTGEFSVGPWQGQPQRAGYHLTYRPGKTLSLLRVNSRGRAVIEASTRPVRLEDKKVHTLRWTRDASGRMQVTLDKNTLIDVSDRSFSDPFDGIVIINKGTDVIVKSINVDVAG